ncbi:phenylacetic acid degradation bifunctional protein PaaZ [Microbacterium sp. X-17]|uniref:phenylacetic acid degradation bifunctional protein PaaZ n=1 Tax=Microbacterium sp. X-17 TaxID=3144404 RepID=UPI0031F49ED5
MVTLLESYANGSWFRSGEEGAPLRDAATGEEVARISSAGLDLSAMVERARTVGGPALRDLTFLQRADLLEAVVGVVESNLDELYELSFHTGTTRPHSAVDIFGATYTANAYVAIARSELPDAQLYLDGPVLPLSADGSFSGRHLYSSRPGVAVHINAFNFPLWGFLEKFSTSLLAGLPSILKPASQGAYVAERAVRRIVEAGVLPDGVLQLVSGSAAGLLDRLGVHDVVAFTGSASTAATLRADPAVVHRGVTLGVEADSLNATILGPDVEAGSPEFDLFVQGVLTETTVKSGQKCTAIRRIFVPEERAAEVADAVAARFAEVTVGDPRRDDVTMGALVSLEQRDLVREAVRTIERSGRVVFGDPSAVDVVDGDAERGAFMGPILLQADGAAREPNEVEPFGPVTTLIPFADLDEAAGLVARGGGSLAGSLVTHDPDVAAQVVRAIAPWHGRILVLDRDAAAASTGHGTPLPELVHGGPGRAGGSEELSGIRSILHQMQRSAVQGSPAMLDAIAGSQGGNR